MNIQRDIPGGIMQLTVFVVDAAAFRAVDIADGREDEVAQLEDGSHEPEDVGHILRTESHRLERFLQRSNEVLNKK